MYPLLQLGPLNLSSGGLMLLIALVLGSQQIERIARKRGGEALSEQAAALLLPTIIGAAIGGRLWYGLLNWDLYGRNPWLFLAPRLAELAWPGALLGGILAAWLWCRLRSVEPLSSADSAALGLPPAQAIACLGLLLSGEAFGEPTSLPWGIELFGAIRHPTQLYLALAALFNLPLLYIVARRNRPPGALFALYLGLQGLTLLLIEPLRADSLLLPYGIRAAQVFGLGLLLGAMLWWRAQNRRSGLEAKPVAPFTPQLDR